MAYWQMHLPPSKRVRVLEQANVALNVRRIYFLLSLFSPSKLAYTYEARNAECNHPTGLNNTCQSLYFPVAPC